jgi:hypothetical protein
MSDPVEALILDLLDWIGRRWWRSARKAGHAYSSGFTKFIPAAIAGFFYVVAIWLMAIAMRQLEMGVTYAVWAGPAVTPNCKCIQY